MKKKFLSIILAVFMLLPFAAANVNGTESNWRYIVPFGRYNYCEILSNGLILAGKKVDKFQFTAEARSREYAKYTYEIDMLYGLLDSSGKLLTDIEYIHGIYDINADGWMVGEKINGNTIQQVLFNAKGEIVPMPANGKITLFDHSYAVEIPGGYILGVNNQTYRVYKSDIRKAGITTGNPQGYTADYIEAVYGKCFVMRCDYQSDVWFHPNIPGSEIVVFNLDGTLRYKASGLWRSTPDGLVEITWQFRGYYLDTVMTDFDGNVLIPRAYGRTGAAQLYDSVTKKAVPGIYVYDGYYPEMSDRDYPNNYYQGIWDINNTGEFKAFRWTLYQNVVDCDTKNKLLYLRKDGKMGLYTFAGKQILPFEYTEIYRESGGFIRYANYDLDDNWEKHNQVYGFVNLKGEKVFESSELELRDFSEGLCQFKKYDGKNGKDIYGFMNDKFKVVLEKEEWFIENGLKNGITITGSQDYYNGFGGFAFINQKGETVISPEDIIFPSPTEAAKKGELRLEAKRGADGLIFLKRYYRFHTGKGRYDYDDRYATYGIIQYSGD